MPCAVSILFFPQSCKDTGNSLGDGEQLLFRKKSIEKLRLMRNGSETTTNVEFESAPLNTIFRPRHCDCSEIVHVDKSAACCPGNPKTRP